MTDIPQAAQQFAGLDHELGVADQQRQALAQMQQERAMHARVTALQLAIEHARNNTTGDGRPEHVVKSAAAFEAFIVGASPTEQRQ